MATSLWHSDDIAQIGATLIAIAPSLDFAAGVAAVCNAVGAPVRLPKQPPAPVVVVDVTSNEREKAL